MIIVKPNGGLGNRMRTIHSAIVLSEILNTRVTVLWKKDPGLNAGFFELFQPIPEVRIIQGLIPMAWRFYCAKELLKYTYFDDTQTEKYRFNDSFWMEQKEDLLLNTCFDFLNPHEVKNKYHFFKPVDSIQIRVDSLTERFNKNTIGIQIRRTDHIIAKENSKTEHFILKMKNLIEKNEGATFFLATDDRVLENELKEVFGQKVIVQENKILERNSLEGIQSALVDMYALSKTNHIIGSYISSFGEVAAGIGGIEYTSLKTTTNNVI